MNIKKISFFSIGLVLVIAFSAFLVNKNMHDPRIFSPVISFNMEKLDLGEVPQGPQIQGEFQFKNIGQTVLEIKSVKPSCGCTGVIQDEKKQFQPGETGTVKFTFNTEGRSGHNEKTITVESNDIKNGSKVLTFSCNITAPAGK